jgi:hypothetical protein
MHPDETLGLAVNRRGTWVPSDSSGAGLVLTIDSATWVAHNRLVIARTFLTYPVTASGLPAELSGLPFPVVVPNCNRQGFITYSGIAAARYVVPVGVGATTLRFYDAAGAQLTNAQMSGGLFYFTCMYDAN